MTPADRRLLNEFLSLDPERRCAPDVLKRLRRAGWTEMTIASLTQLSLGEVADRLRAGTRC